MVSLGSFLSAFHFVIFMLTYLRFLPTLPEALSIQTERLFLQTGKPHRTYTACNIQGDVCFILSRGNLYASGIGEKVRFAPINL